MANVTISALATSGTITPASDVLPVSNGTTTTKVTPLKLVNSVLNGTTNLGVGTITPLNKLDIVGSFGRGAPITKTTDFTLAAAENWIINNKAAATCIVTLPAASLWTGREVMILNYQAFTVVSATANIVPIIGGAATTSILPATAGKRVTLVANGTNWVIMDNN